MRPNDQIRKCPCCNHEARLTFFIGHPRRIPFQCRTDGVDRDSLCDSEQILRICPACDKVIHLSDLKLVRVLSYKEMYQENDLRFQNKSIESILDDITSGELIVQKNNSFKPIMISCIQNVNVLTDRLYSDESKKNSKIAKHLRILIWRFWNSNKYYPERYLTNEVDIITDLINDFKKDSNQKYLLLAELYRNVGDFESAKMLLQEQKRLDYNSNSDNSEWHDLINNLCDQKTRASKVFSYTPAYLKQIFAHK